MGKASRVVTTESAIKPSSHAKMGKKTCKYPLALETAKKDQRIRVVRAAPRKFHVFCVEKDEDDVSKSADTQFVCIPVRSGDDVMSAALKSREEYIGDMEIADIIMSARSECRGPSTSISHMWVEASEFHIDDMDDFIVACDAGVDGNLLDYCDWIRTIYGGHTDDEAKNDIVDDREYPPSCESDSGSDSDDDDDDD